MLSAEILQQQQQKAILNVIQQADIYALSRAT